MNIRVNGIAPGIIKTDFSKAVKFFFTFYRRARIKISSNLFSFGKIKIPKNITKLARLSDGRIYKNLPFSFTKMKTCVFSLGTSDDCSGAVSFLCSDQSTYITGETIMITGGISARL